MRSKYFRSGQAVLLIVLVTMLTGLGVGLAAVSRFSKSSRETSYNVQSDQSFACAEAGVELAVECIKNSSNPLSCGQADYKSLSDEPSSCQYKYSVSEVTGEEPDGIAFSLKKDQTEVLMVESGANPNKLTAEWEQNSEGNVLEFNLLTKSGDGYTLKQIDYKCNYAGGDVSASSGSNLIDATTGTGSKCAIPGPGYLDVAGVSLVQITPRLKDIVNIHVTITSAPVQGYKVVAEGKAGQVERSVEVLYMLDNIARVFNSTLYAESIN